MDLSQTIIAKSDQLNADDLISGPQTFTVVEVRQGDAEQPVSIVLAELPKGRTFKPSKTVTRIFVHAWGKETDAWPEGARMTLFRDADVKWAGQAIGGIRVSHLSHIKGKLKVALQESKGKKVLYTVDPLPDAAPERPATPPLTDAMIACCADQAQLKSWWHEYPDQQPAIGARKAELDADTTPDVTP